MAKVLRIVTEKKSLILVLLAVFFAALQASAQSESVTSSETATATQKIITLKVMTINLRHNLDYWEDRFPLIADEIVRLKPDLIGLQELAIDIGQSRTLMKLIEERSGPGGLKYEKYEHLKTGKDMFYGEGVAIFSRYPIEKKGFADLENGRVAVFTRIKIDDGLTVDFYNTHLHHRGGDEVRRPQAQKIVDVEKKHDGGFITFLTGDMNSADDSGTIKYFMDNSFADTYKSFHGDETPVSGNTAPILLSKGNPLQNPMGRIDYVFMKAPPGYENRVRILDSVVCFRNYNEQGLYPSDHLGVMTTVEIKY